MPAKAYHWDERNAKISNSPGIKDLLDLDPDLCCNSGNNVLFTHQSQFLPAAGSLQVLFLDPVTLKALKFYYNKKSHKLPVCECIQRWN